MLQRGVDRIERTAPEPIIIIQIGIALKALRARAMTALPQRI